MNNDVVDYPLGEPTPEEIEEFVKNTTQNVIDVAAVEKEEAEKKESK